MRTGRVGARSPRAQTSQGLRSVQPRDQSRERQQAIQSSPWGKMGRRHPATQKATDIENLLRYALVRKGINYIEQANIGPWCVDFYLPDHNACVEADGEYWHGTVAAKIKDRRKDAWLRNKGYSVFHFDGWDIKQDADFCVSRLIKALDSSSMQPVSDIEDFKETDIDEQPSIEPIEQQQPEDEYEAWIRGEVGP